MDTHIMNEEEYFKKLHHEENDSEKSKTTPRTPKAAKDKYLPWEKFYMAMAFLVSQRREDPRTKVSLLCH